MPMEIEAAPLELKRASCEHQFEDELLCVSAFRNHYRCSCGTEWTDEWSCTCNDRCPNCNTEIEPYLSDEIASCACEHLGLKS
jgi:hypothetical protein